MGKRGNGEGSVSRRPNGTWEARLTLPDGRRVVRYAKTQAEAVRKLAALRRERDDGLPVVSSERRTVGEYLESWLEMKSAGVRRDVRSAYGFCVSAYIVPSIGRVRLAKLSAEHVQRMIADLSAPERGLAPATVHKAYSVLRTALNQAVRLGLVARNVALLVDRPRVGRREMRCWDPEQALRFLDVARSEEPRLYALYVVALTTGLREGELLALRWRDVVLDEAALTGALRVQHTLHWGEDGRMRLEEVKTPMSRRHVQLSSYAVRVLLQHRAAQDEERRRLGAIWRDHELVFCNRMGGALRVSILRRRSFLRLVELAGVPRIRFYDMRHTAATLLLVGGVHPKIVSEMLGHSSVAITLSIYSHVLPMLQGEAAATMDRLLGRPSVSSPAKLLGGLVDADAPGGS